MGSGGPPQGLSGSTRIHSQQHSGAECELLVNLLFEDILPRITGPFQQLHRLDQHIFLPIRVEVVQPATR